MAITATITLSSAAGDLMTDALSLSDKATLTKAASSTAIAQTTGLAVKTTTATSNVTLFAAATYGDDKSHKVYVKLITATPSLYIRMSYGGTDFGWLYGGDWMLIPWDGRSDLSFTPGSTAEHKVEYMMFYED